MPESLSFSNPEEQEQEQKHQEEIPSLQDLGEIEREILEPEQVPRKQIEERNLLQILIIKVTNILRDRGYNDVKFISRNPHSGTFIFSAKTQEGTEVIVKIFNFWSLEDRVSIDLHQRYTTEVSILQRLKEHFRTQHPQLGYLPFPKLIESFEISNEEVIGDAFFIVMEKINGQPLSQKIIITEDEIRSIIKNILRILHFLNSIGYVHRDLRSENIFFDEASGRVYLIDFDLARSVLRTSYTMIEPTGFYPPDAYEFKPRFNVDLVAIGRIILQIILKNDFYEYLERRKLQEAIKSLPFSEDLKLFLSKLIEENPEKRIFENAQEALKSLENPSLLISGILKTESKRKKPSIREKRRKIESLIENFLVLLRSKKESETIDYEGLLRKFNFEGKEAEILKELLKDIEKIFNDFQQKLRFEESEFIEREGKYDMTEEEQWALVLSLGGAGSVTGSITAYIISIISMISNLPTSMLGGFILGGIAGLSIGGLSINLLARFKFFLHKRRVIKEFQKSLRILINTTLKQLENI